ncbi:MAG: M23 family metallopeptidase [Geodermatophilaceae bacterium]
MSRHARPSSRPTLGPPTRKAPLLLTALVAGALVAALPSGLGAAQDAPSTIPVAYAVTAQGGDARGSAPIDLGDDGLAVARRGLTATEAQARLQVLGAQRASRDAKRVADAARRAAEAARPTTVLPVHGRLTTCFCMRWGTMHWGIDLAAPLLTPISAAADGVVLQAGPASGFGNVIYIQHENGDVTVYGHMEVVEVAAGDLVRAGEEIAKVGSRGYSTGPHLHFEVHLGGLDGTRVDPLVWLAARGVRL